MTWLWLTLSLLGGFTIGALYGYRKGYDKGHLAGWCGGTARLMSLWATEERRQQQGAISIDHPDVAEYLASWTPERQH